MSNEPRSLGLSRIVRILAGLLVAVSREANRQQIGWRAVDGERLIGGDHRARTIWTLGRRLVLSLCYRVIGSSAE
jgi:hypothetical protein